MITFPEETDVWRLQFLRYDKAFQLWERKTELYPTEAAALKEALEMLTDPETYKNISIKRTTGETK